MDTAHPSPMPRPMPRLRVTPDEARRMALDPGRLSARLLAHGTMEVRWYVPPGADPQTPHDRDELYMIASGTAVFVRAEERAPFQDNALLSLAGEERVSVQAGDLLFVPAGTAHRFEAMSPDFGSWMVFYGPEGGEGA